MQYLPMVVVIGAEVCLKLHGLGVLLVTHLQVHSRGVGAEGHAYALHAMRA